MPIVRSRLRDHADVTTHASVFRRDDALDYLYFTDSFGAHDLDFGNVPVHAQHLRASIAARTSAVDRGAHRAASEPVQLITRAAHCVGSEVVSAQARPGGSDDRRDIAIDHR